MAALTDAPKDSPESAAQQALDAVEAGQVEVLADDRTRTVKAEPSRDHELIFPPIQKFWDNALKAPTSPDGCARYRTGRESGRPADTNTLRHVHR